MKSLYRKFQLQELSYSLQRSKKYVALIIHKNREPKCFLSTTITTILLRIDKIIPKLLLIFKPLNDIQDWVFSVCTTISCLAYPNGIVQHLYRNFLSYLVFFGSSLCQLFCYQLLLNLDLVSTL